MRAIAVLIVAVFVAGCGDNARTEVAAPAAPPAIELAAWDLAPFTVEDAAGALDGILASIDAGDHAPVAAALAGMGTWRLLSGVTHDSTSIGAAFDAAPLISIERTSDGWAHGAGFGFRVRERWVGGEIFATGLVVERNADGSISLTETLTP